MNTLKEKDGKYYQEANIVILSNDKPSMIFYSHIENKLIYLNAVLPNTSPKSPNYNLYITTSEEIKEGDMGYKYCSNTNTVLPIFHGKNGLCKDCKKIIATTDTSLKLYESETLASASGFSLKTDDIILPQPSKEFIQAYIESYNVGKPIESVLVEVNIKKLLATGCEALGWFKEFKNYKLKDNNIIIKKKEEKLYTQSEVIDLIKKCDFSGLPLDVWIKDYFK